MPEIPTMPSAPNIAVIIPAYNEAKHIRSILAVLHEVDIITEIIVVDDGSDDDTPDQVRQAALLDARLRLIQHPVNQGKGQTIFTAWIDTQASFIILLDADLKNFKPDHVLALITPILNNTADMTLGLFLGGHINTDLSHWLAPWLTGQRGLRAEIFKHVSREAASGYGFEVALTIAARLHNYRTHIIPLRGVWHPPSEFHRGGWYGVKWRGRMYAEIIRALYISTRLRYPNARAFFSDILKS